MTPTCRIRKYRKSLALTQAEVAALAGLRTQGVLSEVEAGSRAPSVHVALCCSAIFDAPLSELFPGVCADIETRIVHNARALLQRISSEKGRERTRSFLAALISRSDGINTKP